MPVVTVLVADVIPASVIRHDVFCGGREIAESREAILATHVNITIDIFQILQAWTGSLRCNLSILL